MSDRITRRELLRRGAAGGALLTVPGLLAACGGSKKAATTTTAAVAQKLPKTITFSNWPLYIDVEGRRRIRRSTPFKKHYGVKVRYIEDINDNDSFFGKIEGPLSQGQSDRPRHHRPDRLLRPARPDDRARLAREARQVGDPEHQEPPADAAASRLGPEPRLQPAVAVGHDRHRLRPEARRRRHHLAAPSSSPTRS